MLPDEQVAVVDSSTRVTVLATKNDFYVKVRDITYACSLMTTSFGLGSG